MAKKNWKNFFKRKLRQHKKDFNFNLKKKDDVIDFGEKAYKFDGKRWIASKEEDEQELEISDSYNVDDPDSFASSKALRDLSLNVDVRIANLVDSAPSKLNTLNELAAALDDDKDHVTTMIDLVGTKLSLSGGSMTGAITTTSTFDGRDVATDGNKLDGIEASADVTDTTNVVASLTAGTNVAISDGGTVSSTDTNTWRGISSTPTKGSTTTSISSDWAYDNVKKAVPANAVFTDTNTNTTYSQFAGTTAGLVPTSSSTDDTKFLRADGEWVVPTDTNTNTVYTHPSTAGNKHIPSGGSSGQFLKYNSSGTATWATPSYTTNTNTTYSQFAGTTAGLVPASTSAETEKFLRADGTWVVPTDTTVANTDTVYTHPSTAGNKHIPSGGSSGQFLKYNSSGTATWATPSYTTNTNTVYTHPSTAGNKHIPTGGSSGQFLKYNSSGTATWATPSYTTNTNTTYSSFSGTTAGLVPTSTTTDDTKFLRADGTWVVPTDTNTVYTHPSTAGNKHIPTGGAAGQFLTYNGSGMVKWATPSYTTNTNTTYSTFTGTTTGLVPGSTTNDDTMFLRADGNWRVPTDTITTYAVASATYSGLMSKTDKIKLDGIEEGATAGGVSAAAGTYRDLPAISTISQENSNQWKSVAVNVPSHYTTGSTNYAMVWCYTAGASYTGDFAIDNIRQTFANGSTRWLDTESWTNWRGSRSDMDKTFSNDQRAIDWALGSSYNPLGTATIYGGWMKRSGSTPSGSTGPSSAYNGNYYAFTETSGTGSYDSMALIPHVHWTGDGISPTTKIEFNYHSYGATIGTMRLLLIPFEDLIAYGRDAP